MGSKSGDQITGYKYYLAIHMGLCRGPIDSICHIVVDTTDNAWQGNMGDLQTFPIIAPNLFGGDTAEGGLLGYVTTYFGGKNQIMEQAHKDLMGQDVPEFRGRACLFWDGTVGSNNPYLKAWKIRVRRTTQGWDNDTCWYPAKVTVPIASLRMQFFNNPDPGSQINFNGTIVTYVSGAGTSPPPLGPNQIYTQNNPAHNARQLQNYLNANPRFGLIASTTNDEFADDNQLTLTLLDADTSNANYSISTNATNRNPELFGATGLIAGGIQAMNPAHIIYEVCTNRAWGRGLATSMVDDASFRAGADAFFAEGFGLCLKWSQQDSLANFLQLVCDHAGCAVYISRATGLLTLKLLRADYDPTTIPHFDAYSGLLAVDNDDSSASSTSFNEILVSYHDPVQDVDLQVRAQNLASFKANQAILSQTNSYPGIPTAALAARVASRDLLQQSEGLKRFTVKLDQRGRFLNPGDVFRITDPTRGIANMVLRVGTLDNGTAINQEITVTTLQDVFNLPVTSYVSTTAPSGWVPPNNTPAPATIRAFFETSYRDLSHYLSPADLAVFPTTSGGVMNVAGNPGLVSAAYSLNIGVGSAPLAIAAKGGYVTTGDLAAPLAFLSNAMVLENLRDTTFLPASGTPFCMLVGGEYLRVDSYDLSTNIFNIARGCIDTVPMEHTAGTGAMQIDFRACSDFTEYTEGEVISGQVLPITSKATLDPSLAPTDTVTIVARHNLPYPPGNVTVNGSPYDPQVSARGSDIVFAWASRNRVLQADALIDESMASVSPEAGTTYNLRIYKAGSLIREQTGLNVLTWTYTQANQNADGLTYGLITVQLESERDGLTSYTKFDFPVLILPVSGWDANWGQSWDETGNGFDNSYGENWGM